jgi:hypothetical protein
MIVQVEPIMRSKFLFGRNTLSARFSSRERYPLRLRMLD